MEMHIELRRATQGHAGLRRVTAWAHWATAWIGYMGLQRKRGLGEG